MFEIRITMLSMLLSTSQSKHHSQILCCVLATVLMEARSADFPGLEQVLLVHPQPHPNCVSQRDFSVHFCCGRCLYL